MKISLHLGPHRTGTTYIQNTAFQNRVYLAQHGVHFINRPAQSNRLAQALVDERVDIALAEFDRLSQDSKNEFGAADSSTALLYSSSTFFTANPRRGAAYQAGVAEFVATLEQRGHAIELVFVERDLADLLTSYALLLTSLGNLQFVTSDPSPYLAYVERLAWMKQFYFDNFKVTHLSFSHLTSAGDLFGNLMKSIYGLDLPGLKVTDAADARNSPSDEQIAKGLMMAPLINWMEQFGGVSRLDLLNGPQPLQPPIEGASWDKVVASVPLLRDGVRGMVRRLVKSLAAEQKA